MRATAIPKKGAASFEELKPACQILILHEDFSAYTRAVDVCRRVMERFANELDFDIKCWNFIELVDPNCARHAAKSAGGADLVLLSTHTSQLPVEVDRWLDYYFISRFRADGTFLFVLNSPNGSELALEKCLSRLEISAKRLGMDFISLFSYNDMALMDLQPVTAALRASRP
jgi:hypothetical protein